MEHGYDRGRLDLPFTGICTFAKRPICTDWDNIGADVAILGIPYDMGTQYRSGARFGPRAIREASTLFSFGHSGAYDHEDGVVYLPPDKVAIVDIGDSDVIHTDTATSHGNAEFAVRKILNSGALPVILGGDHAVNIPCVRAFRRHGPIHIVQIDAHLDFVDVRHGVREGHGNPMRRAAEQDHVTGLTQIGIRNVSSTAREGYDEAIARNSTIISVRQARRMGAAGVVARIPAGKRYYVTIDIDGFDPSIAPGTGTPSHGGFLYYEVMEMLQGLAARGDIVGIDLVEVSPPYDASGITGFLAAQVLLNFLGYIFEERHRRKAAEGTGARRENGSGAQP
ncbi:MAG TPA: agmatinase [Xanthobacteraceae bacterium]|nr:agmatinase [Xanthobacteraceae bacterium]